MANQSIYKAFERMWQHIVAHVGGKFDELNTNLNHLSYTINDLEEAVDNARELSWINVVKDYGVDNTGKTNVGNVIQNIINEVDDFSVLYFPKGDYLFETGITINKKITLVGDSKFIDNIPRLGGSSTRFTTKGISNFTMIVGSASNYAIENILFFSDSATTIENESEPTNGNPHYHYEVVKNYENVNAIIDSSDSSKCLFNNVYISGFSGTGLKSPLLSTLNNVLVYSCGLGIETQRDCSIFNSRTWGCENGCSADIGTSVHNCRFEECQKHALILKGQNKCTDCTIDQCGYAGLVLRNYANDVTYIGKITRCGQYYFGTPKDSYLSDENRIEEAFSLVFFETQTNAITIMIRGKTSDTYSDTGTSQHEVYLLKGNTENCQLLLKQIPDLSSIHYGSGHVSVVCDKIYNLANGNVISENGISLIDNIYETRLQHRGGNLYVLNNNGNAYRKVFIPEKNMIICTSYDNSQQVGWSYGGTWEKTGSLEVGESFVYFYKKVSD